MPVPRRLAARSTRARRRARLYSWPSRVRCRPASIQERAFSDFLGRGWVIAITVYQTSFIPADAAYEGTRMVTASDAAPPPSAAPAGPLISSGAMSTAMRRCSGRRSPNMPGRPSAARPSRCRSTSICADIFPNSRTRPGSRSPSISKPSGSTTSAWIGSCRLAAAPTT